MSSYQLSGPAELACDVLVIGTGAGGACVAEVMTRAGRDVLMVEEGPYVPHDRVPANVTDSFLSMWRGGGITVALGKTPIAYAEGRCVGGGTEINSAIFQRTPPELIERWARDYEIHDLSPTMLDAYYERAARIVNSSPTPAPLGRASELLHDAGKRLDWKVVPLERGQRSCVGTNLCSFGCPTGGKQSMTATLIPAAIRRGARLVARCRIDRLAREGNRVGPAQGTAVTVSGERCRVRIRANRVFVCGGAIQTPALLQRSGVKGAIGKSLRMHPTVKVLTEFDEDVYAFDDRLPLYAITEFMPDIRIGGSVMRPGVFGMALAEDWIHRKDLFGRYKKMGAYYAMVRAAGRGRVRALPGIDDPFVSYAMEERDRDLLAEGLLALTEAMFAVGAKRVIPSLRGHKGWSHLDDARTEISRGLDPQRINLMTIHIFSSCPMGGDERRVPVDPWGQVYGFDNLYVADASLIPEAPAVNPQATIMALALHVAERALDL